jgi:hypothetical protein
MITSGEELKCSREEALNMWRKKFIGRCKLSLKRLIYDTIMFGQDQKEKDLIKEVFGSIM